VDQLRDQIRKPESNARSRRLAHACVVLAILLTGMAGILSWRISQRAAEDADSVAHTYNVTATLELTLRNLDDVETGARGFALTGQDRFLEPYISGSYATRLDLEKLRTLISDNPGQQRRLGVLAEQAKTQLDATADLVNARQNLAKIPDAAHLDHGKEVMDKIRASIAGMEDQEKLLLEQRTQRVQNTRRFTALVIGLSSIFGIIFLFIAGLTVSREIGVAAKAQTQIRALNADLERRVEQRTAALEAESSARLESEGRLAAVIKSAMDSIIIVDDEQRIVLFNQAAEKMFQCPQNAAMGRPIAGFIPNMGGLGEGGFTNQAMGLQDALWAVRANGEKFQIEASISQNEIAGRQMFTVILRDITERKQVEQMRDRLAAVVDSSDDAIISKTLDGTIVAWNRGAEKVFGYAVAEMVGKSMLILLPPERIKEESDILARIGAGESVQHFETVRVRKDGAKIDVSATISPIRDGQGVVVGASKIIRDITGRKLAEEALREKERRLSESQRIAHIGSWSCDPADPEGRLSWSEEVYCIYGVSPDAFVPTVESLLSLLVSEDRPAMRKWIAACTAGEKPGDMEFRVRLPDGQTRIFRRRGELQNQIGNGSIRLVGTVQDVTELRLAEQELRAQADLIDLSHDVIMVRELDGRIRFWNRGAEETYGYTREHAVGLISNALLHSVFPRPLVEIEAEFLRNGRWEGELTHTTQAGKRIVVESRWVLQRDRNGQPSHVMEANNDITVRKQAEEASRQAKLEAEEANSAKSNFLANMSHEIRTPMNAILGMTYLALRAGPAPEQRKYLSKISGAADSLLAIINDILDFSKMEAGKMELENIIAFCD
jgi:PAS domain S-box-containing protein